MNVDWNNTKYTAEDSKYVNYQYDENDEQPLKEYVNNLPEADICTDEYLESLGSDPRVMKELTGEAEDSLPLTTMVYTES